MDFHSNKKSPYLSVLHSHTNTYELAEDIDNLTRSV